MTAGTLVARSKMLFSSSRSLVVFSAASLLLSVVAAALQARLLGPTGRGELAAAVVPATLVAMLLTGGVPDYVARTTAIERSAVRASAVSIFLAAVVAVVTVPVYSVIVLQLPGLNAETRFVWMAYVIGTPFFLIGYDLIAARTGQGAWFRVGLSKVLPQVFALCGLAAATVLNFSVSGIGLVLMVSAVLGTLLPAIGRSVGPKMKLVSRSAVTEAVSFSLRGWVPGALALLNQRVDLLAVTFVATRTDLGYYAISTTVASVLGVVPASVGLGARNRVARGDVDVAATACRAAVLLTAILGGLLAALIHPIVAMVLGPSFLPAVPIILVLIAGQVPLAAVVVLTLCVVGHGRPGSPLLGELGAILLTASIIVALVPVLGLMAAALANIAGTLLSLGVLLVLARRFFPESPLRDYFAPSRSDVERIRRAIVAVTSKGHGK